MTNTTLDTTSGLVADNDAANGVEFIGTGTAAHDLPVGSESGVSGGGGKAVVTATTFPAGVTVYGRWTKVTTATSGQYIAYIGN